MKKSSSNNLLRNKKNRSIITNFLAVLLSLLLYVNSLEESKNYIIYKDSEFLLFLTKNGSLSAYQNLNKTNKTWEIYLREHLFFTNNINNEKITDDISFYMIHNKSYIIKNNELIPYNVFIYDLVNSNNYVYNDKNDFFLKGKIIYTYLIIDSTDGKILEKIKDINNDSLILKKLHKFNKGIILKSEEYQLEKIDRNTNKNLINITVSDIHILTEDKNDNNFIYNEKEGTLGKFIEELKIKINLDEIISIYNYTKGNIHCLYNKNIFAKKIYGKASNDKEIKELIKENNSVLNKLFKYDILNTFLVLACTIILIILFKSFQRRQSTVTTNNFNNIAIINKINDNENNQLVKYKKNEILDLVKNKEKHFYKMDLSHSRSSNDLVGRKNNELVLYNDKEDINNDNNNFMIEQNCNLDILNKFIMDGINQYDVEKIIKPVKNNIEIKSSNYNPITKEIFLKLEENTKKKITLKIPENKFMEYKNIFNQKNSNLFLPQKKESLSISKKETPIKGIWDESIDESLDESKDEKSISINSNNKNNIESNKKINDEINLKEKENSDKNIIRKVRSRLDEDFKNLEKIGEGGFGVVLKGVHRLDKGINAIKIIKLSSLNDKENIINEAITMTKISSKHIVQYKTCWIDNKLGSASKFFDKDEEDDNDNNNENNIDNSNSNNMSIMSKSQSCFFNKRKKKDENDKDSISSDDSDDSNYDGMALKRNISKDLLKIKNNKDNNSQEFKKRKNSKALTKYYNDFRDDSYMIKESNLSKQLNEENNNYNMQQSDYSYYSHYAKYFFILMEYCDGLTLDLYIKQHANSSIDRKIIYSFTQQLLKSLSKIHSGGIIHRDIKPSNIFIKNDQIKIGDFGLATRYSTSKLLRANKIEGTPLYLSPEQTTFKSYNEKVDIYACGITLYEMCSCFYTSMERYESITNLRNNEIIDEKVVKNYPEETELIKLITKKDYNERPTANEILKSDLFINLGKKLGF